MYSIKRIITIVFFCFCLVACQKHAQIQPMKNGGYKMSADAGVEMQVKDEKREYKIDTKKNQPKVETGNDIFKKLLGFSWIPFAQ